MGPFHGKESATYLSQLDVNGREKAGHLYELIESNRLPVVGERIRVLELGVGSGRTFKELTKNFPDRKDIEYLGMDRSALFAGHFIKEVNAPAVVADAGRLPFADQSLSAVNVSAVLHEVSSYGVSSESGKLYGAEAIHSVLQELSRVLTTQGALTYRDVYCPEHALKTVDYSRPSWVEFIDRFLPRFIATVSENQPSMIDDMRIVKSEDGRNITASTRVHREIQRHYITFRDFMRRVAFPNAGLHIVDEDWTAQRNGLKYHDIALVENQLEWMSDELLLTYPETEPRILRLDSPAYDDLTDRLIEKYFRTSNSDEFFEWQKREGSEVYTYATLNELSEMAADVGFVEEPSSRRLAPRQYYQQYLARIIPSAEYEGKQLTTFIKN